MRYFIPFLENSPKAIEVKGHRLVIVATDPDEIMEFSEFLGNDEIREMSISDDDNEALASLAASVQGGVVVTPPGIAISVILSSLEDELPWVQ